MRNLAVAAVMAVAQAMDQETFSFIQYVSRFGKAYSSIEEFEMRRDTYVKTEAFIREWNNDKSKTSTMGHNKFSDWTEEEKKKLRGHVGKTVVRETFEDARDKATALETLNWCSTENDTGMSQCSPVKDQGSCGSCWAFSATEATESALSIVHGQYPVPILSTQQMVSCSSSYGNNGCGGGQYHNVWNYMVENAQETEQDYPYSAQTYQFGVSGSCKADTSIGVVKCNATTPFIWTKTTNTDVMMELNVQPLSVAVDAASPAWHQYNGGVIQAEDCGIDLDHDIVAVGYGTTAEGIDYWLVRNSWGADWGLSGFAMVAQSPTGGSPGVCGIQIEPAYPIVVPV